MNISLITAVSPSKSYKNTSYKSTSFKGNNNSDGTQPAQPKPSAQNNSPDLFIPTETYLKMSSNSLAKGMKEDGIFKFSAEEVSEIASQSAQASDFSEFLGNILSSEMMGEQSAKAVIFGLKQQGLGLIRSLSEDKRSKVPAFINMTPENFIEAYNESMNKLKNAGIGDFSQPDTEEDKGELSEQGQYILDLGMSIIQDEDFIESISDMQKNLMQALKTTQSEELKEALEIYSKGLNCMLYGIIENSVKRSPKDVINLLTDNIMVYTQPKIKDNQDGTSTLTYSTFQTVYEVTRNNSNGDYIKATGKSLSELLFDVDFREDGSIKKLDYVNSHANTKVTIEQDSKGSKFKVTQTLPHAACQRIFNRTADGTLEPIDLKFFTE